MKKEIEIEVQRLVSTHDTSLHNVKLTGPQRITFLQLTPLSSEPDNLREGLLVCADNSNWDPNDVAGTYPYLTFYDGTSWLLSPSHVTGTSSDSVSDVQTLFDGNTYDVAEVTGTPGFDVEFTFTNVIVPANIIQARLHYEGSSTHGIGVEAYNYSTTTWDRFSHFTDHAPDDFAWIEISIPDMENYRDGSNNMKVRFYHFTAGNSAHTLYIDYVGMRF